MLRYLKLLKFALLITWNLAWLALVVGVPLWVSLKVGWPGAAVVAVFAAGIWLAKRPAALLGLLLGLRLGS
jgi:hypothetical protein